MITSYDICPKDVELLFAAQMSHPIGARMTTDRLKDDPIVEALLDVRFETKELPEVVIGRLSEMGEWHKLVKTRLPTADIPLAFRNANAQMRFFAISRT